jgi:hypothetical protein
MAVFALAVAFMGAGYAWSVVAPLDLPEPYGTVVKCVFPDMHFKAAMPGTAVSEVYGRFGLTPPQGAPARRCVFFQYDSLLFDGALVVLTKQERIDRRWLMKESAEPSECGDVPHETVDLKGWFAAAVHAR